MLATFSPQTAQDWLNQIQKDLKGKSLEEILVKNYEDIPIKAFFVKEDVSEEFSVQINALLKNKPQITLSEEIHNEIKDLLCPAVKFGKTIQEEDWKVFFDELNTKDRFFINLTFLHNAGANAVQELAFVLASTDCYLSKAIEKANLETILSKMALMLATGANFFMEIAKLRVAPYLINRLVSFYLPEKQDYLPYIKVQTAQINKSKQDSYNNIVRATLEAMAASIAQADEIHILPHDYFSDSPDSFSENIAANILRILHYEAKIDLVKDIAAGTYFLEYLSYQLAQKAWDLFRYIQQEGGIVNFAEKGLLKKMVLEVALQKIKDFQEKKIVQIGVNKYPNPKENIAIEKKTIAYLTEGRDIRTFRFEEF
ncbi:MAG: hypothetical protein OHK0045_03320 [Raineya sp.]